MQLMITFTNHYTRFLEESSKSTVESEEKSAIKKPTWDVSKPVVVRGMELLTWQAEDAAAPAEKALEIYRQQTVPWVVIGSFFHCWCRKHTYYNL